VILTDQAESTQPREKNKEVVESIWAEIGGPLQNDSESTHESDSCCTEEGKCSGGSNSKSKQEDPGKEEISPFSGFKNDVGRFTGITSDQPREKRVHDTVGKLRKGVRKRRGDRGFFPSRCPTQ
jgi:hypothetical protein